MGRGWGEHSPVSMKGSKAISKMYNLLKLNLTKEQCQNLGTGFFFSSQDVLEKIQKLKSWGVSSPDSERPYLLSGSALVSRTQARTSSKNVSVIN